MIFLSNNFKVDKAKIAKQPSISTGIASLEKYPTYSGSI